MRRLTVLRAETGEGPVLDPRTGELVWVDIPNGALHRTDVESGETASFQLPTLLGAAVPCAGREGFAVAVREGFGYTVEGRLDVVDPVLATRELRMNDAKCDARGRLWAGSVDVNNAAGRGSLHVWDGRGPSRVEWAGLTLPNGIGWNADGSRMYVVDSLAGAVYVAEFDLDHGRPGCFGVFAGIRDGLPDGLAVDSEGGVWVAMWDGHRVCRFAPTGTITHTIEMPVARPTSCAFLGGGRLAITSARSVEPGSGAVFIADVGYEGAPVSSFGSAEIPERPR